MSKWNDFEWKDVGKIIEEAESKNEVGDMDDLVALCKKDETDLLFYVISEGGKVFAVCEADIVAGRTVYYKL